MSRAMLIIGWAVVLMAFIHLGFFTYFTFMPVTHWIEYYAVEPLHSVVHVEEEPLVFISEIEARKQVSLSFNDVLLCESGNEFQRYSEQNTVRSITGPYERKTIAWPYRPGVQLPTTCYLESNITLHLGGVDRVIQVVGEEFRVE